MLILPGTRTLQEVFTDRYQENGQDVLLHYNSEVSPQDKGTSWALLGTMCLYCQSLGRYREYLQIFNKKMTRTSYKLEGFAGGQRHQQGTTRHYVFILPGTRTLQEVSSDI